MPGTKDGYSKVRQTLIAKYGGEAEYMEFIRERGRKGGLAKKSTPSGFAAATPEQRSEWGKAGGKAGARKRWGKV